MKTVIYSLLCKVKLSQAAYIDYTVAGLSIPILLAYNKNYEALVMSLIMITYFLLAKKLSRNGW